MMPGTAVNSSDHPNVVPRTFGASTHNHLTLVDQVADEGCMICCGPFNEINLDTGRRDLAVQVTGVDGYKYVFGIACLEQIWENYVKSPSTQRTSIHRCRKDIVEWFEERALHVRRGMSESQKKQ